MKHKYKIISMAVIFTALSFSVNAQYTLADEDVVMKDSYIIALTEQGKTNVQGQELLIPESLNGQTVKGIIDKTWTPDLEVPTEGIFANYGITKITLPSTLEHIGDDAFFYNYNMEVIENLHSCKRLTTIGAWAFGDIDKVDNLNLSNLSHLTKIKEFAFEGCDIGTINLSGCTSLVSIEKRAFAYRFSFVTSINLSNCTALNFIGEEAFRTGNYNYQLSNAPDLSSCTSLIYIGKRAFDTDYGTYTSFNLPTPEIGNLTFYSWFDSDNNDVGHTANNLKSSYIALFEEQVISLSGQLVGTRNTNESESSSAAVLKSETEAVHQVKFTIRNHSKNSVDIAGISTSNSGTLSWSNGTIASGNEQEVTITYPDSNYENTIIVKGDNLKGNTTLNITERGDVSSDSNLVPTSTDKPTAEQDNISIYPNPVKNTVTIAVSGNTMQGQTVSIINLAGNTVYQTSNLSNQQTIDISNLPEGIYFVKVGDEVTKLLKQ
jgi:hypothetical protein